MIKKYSAIEYALFLLKLRDRSCGEISQKMIKKGYSEKETSQTIKRLLENKFLDDERFARSYIRQRILIRPQGKYLLRQKLKEKFVKNEDIEKVLAEISDLEEKASAKEVASKWIRLHQNVPSEKLKSKLGLHLARRGFNYDEIKDVYDNLIEINQTD